MTHQTVDPTVAPAVDPAVAPALVSAVDLTVGERLLADAHTWLGRAVTPHDVLAQSRAATPCSWCGQLVAWVVTPGGLVLAVDPTPDPTGTIIRTGVVDCQVLVDDDDRNDGTTYWPEHIPRCTRSPRAQRVWIPDARHRCLVCYGLLEEDSDTTHASCSPRRHIDENGAEAIREARRRAERLRLRARQDATAGAAGRRRWTA